MQDRDHSHSKPNQILQGYNISGQSGSVDVGPGHVEAREDRNADEQTAEALAVNARRLGSNGC